MRVLALIALIIPVVVVALAAGPSRSALALGIGETRVWSVPSVGAEVEFSVTKVVDPADGYTSIRARSGYRYVAVCVELAATSHPLSTGLMWLQGSDHVTYSVVDNLYSTVRCADGLPALYRVPDSLGRQPPNPWASAQLFELPLNVRATAVFFRPNTEFFAGTVAGAHPAEWVIP